MLREFAMAQRTITDRDTIELFQMHETIAQATYGGREDVPYSCIENKEMIARMLSVPDIKCSILLSTTCLTGKECPKSN